MIPTVSSSRPAISSRALFPPRIASETMPGKKAKKKETPPPEEGSLLETKISMAPTEAVEDNLMP